jgi:long-chain acyl-CoA synthetase
MGANDNRPLLGAAMGVNDNRRPVRAGGAIVIGYDNVMQGYWELPDDWSDGEIACVDNSFLIRRDRDLIVRDGFHVHAPELEEVLCRHAAVREAAVVGIPDPLRGEEVVAAVVLKAGETTDSEELREFVRAQVEAYKCPRHIWFVEELPKTETGEIRKRILALPPKPIGE